ncbi:hypothetical protein BFW87_00340 [Pseudomonas fluorescens]|uniref:Uncharacterized protein n=1 Tax=Pseudomonas fluorescens TaxID=294 RepID=A0A1T2Z9X0_PSEFL|nr:hypothetical protein [Pseudomonas fluorescens]OPB00898.1 hypothetical protein BFW87_00340 [Pseudomonas fluorescens]
MEASRSAAMLANVLDGLEHANSGLRRWSSIRALKFTAPTFGQGSHACTRERCGHTPPNLYVAQEAQLRKRAEHSRWDYVALHPDLMVGDIYGDPMNIAMVISVLAELFHAQVPQAIPLHRLGLWPATAM